MTDAIGEKERINHAKWETKHNADTTGGDWDNQVQFLCRSFLGTVSAILLFSTAACFCATWYRLSCAVRRKEKSRWWAHYYQIISLDCRWCGWRGRTVVEWGWKSEGGKLLSMWVNEPNDALGTIWHSLCVARDDRTWGLLTAKRGRKKSITLLDHYFLPVSKKADLSELDLY